MPEGSELDKICLILRSSTGVDFRLYKQTTVRRRIARRMALQKIASLTGMHRSCSENPEEAQALADDIFIHVTSFFRDPECFQALRKRVLAKLRVNRSAGNALRIWVAGCSTGEEVYSIAMLLLEELGERADRTKIQIFGTDIQERAVEQARAGIYTEAAVAGVSPARLKRFFVKNRQWLSDPEVHPRSMRFRAARSGQRSAVFEAGSDQLPERADLHGLRRCKRESCRFSSMR